MKLKELERHLIAIAMKRHDGRRKIVAKELGIGTRTLYNKLKDAKADPDGWKLPDDPFVDARDLVDILREYLGMMSAASRAVLMELISDGYCQRCGTDGKCYCKR